MTKPLRLIVIVAVVAAVIVGGFLYYRKFHALTSQEQMLKKAGEAAETIKDASTKGVLPAINPNSNPMEKAPDVNPISKVNPFSGIKTNPFK